MSGGVGPENVWPRAESRELGTEENGWKIVKFVGVVWGGYGEVRREEHSRRRGAEREMTGRSRGTCGFAPNLNVSCCLNVDAVNTDSTAIIACFLKSL